MNSSEIIAAVTTSVGVITFAVIFTILYHCFAKSSIKEINTGKRDIELMDEYIHSMQRSVKIRRLIWRGIKGLCYWGVLALLIPVFLFSIVNKVQGNVTMVGGKAVMVVASGSMSQKNEANDYLITHKLENQFNTYDIILLEQIDPDELKQYDVIAFVDPTGKNVIHRIRDIEGEGASRRFVTRGDSNNTDDEPSVTAQNIIGRYTNVRVPSLGVFIFFFQSVGGIVTILALIYCLWMLDHYNGKMQDAEEERLERLCGSIELDLEHHRAAGMHAEFLEKVYYKGYAYHFNEKGFVGKEMITDKNYREKSNSSAIRVINSNGERSEEAVHINSQRGDE